MAWREHVTDGGPCWCNPMVKSVCIECDGDGCWACHDEGWVARPQSEVAPGDIGGAVVVHQDKKKG
jgi:hypothetical protein